MMLVPHLSLIHSQINNIATLILFLKLNYQSNNNQTLKQHEILRNPCKPVMQVMAIFVI